MYKNVLFVCTGNSCRSPIAEGIFGVMTEGKDVLVSSAGTMAFDGMPPAENSVLVCKKFGIDISEKTSTFLSDDILAEADIVFVMADHQLQSIKTRFPKYYDKAYLLKKFGREALPIKRGEYMEFDVHDPLGGSLTEYSECYNVLYRELERILPLLKL